MLKADIKPFLDGPDKMTYLLWLYKDGDMINMLGPYPSFDEAKDAAARRGATLKNVGTA